MNTPIWTVRDVRATDEYTLIVTFCDGEQKIYDARPLLNKPIYRELQNLSFFLQAKVECGTVVWNDEVDLAPEHLYECGTNVSGGRFC